MKPPPLPIDENQRLLELKRLNAMDNIIDETYGDITLLASMICQMPLAAITLIDSQRQWFKVPVGFSLASTARSISFCAHAILHDDVLIVSNAHEDSRFCDNPLVLGEPKICFYAGAPLMTSKGANLGTLCVMDYQHRDLDRMQIRALKILANQVIYQLEAAIAVTDSSFAMMQLDTFLNNMNDAVLVESEERQVIYVNQVFAAMFDFPPLEKIQGVDSIHIFHELGRFFDSPENFVARIETIIAQRQPITREELLTEDDRAFERDYVPAFDHELYRGHVWIYHDVTERKRMEDIVEKQRMQIIESSKMAAIGEMAAGMAHEINNPLAIIHGKVQHLGILSRKKDLNSDAVLKAGTVIDDNVNRIGKILGSLRAFAKEDVNEPFQVVPLEDVIASALGFCASRFAFHGVALKISDIPSSVKVSCRPFQLAHCLLNLLNNAFDAAQHTPGEKWIRLDILNLEQTLSIKIVDCGCGVPASLQSKILLPFFTTKDIGKGTGLGLSLAISIVESHGGRLYLDPQAEHTTFVVELPKID